MGEEQAVSAVTVRAELRRILDASERNRRFLTDVVEGALAGRSGRIKACRITTSVVRRDKRFDAQLDSIVRIEAGRLRRSLKRYYLTDGRANPQRIDIPRGGYIPVFGCVEPLPSRPAPSGLPRVLVTALGEGDQSAFPSFTRGFSVPGPSSARTAS
jgi:hypothetical protein